MLTSDLVNDLLAPIAADDPCGSDLEYDPAFMVLVADSLGKPEQQFGDTIIAAIEPDWAQSGAQATGILKRSKDLRGAVLLLRAATRTQGLEGARLGLELLSGLLDRFWDGVHPQLDADDDNDPTMRLNALAALNDEGAVVRDLYDVTLGIAAGIGPIRVRDLATARGTLAATGDGSSLSPTVVQGGLDDILAAAPERAETMRALSPLLTRMVDLVAERSGRTDTLDLTRLAGVARLLGQSAPTGTSTTEGTSEPTPEDRATHAGDPSGSPANVPRGEIHTRQDALQTLDRVIRFLEQAEPGNPAPLLIARAKQLIGVSFLDIMANLAPNALDTIQVITGPRPES